MWGRCELYNSVTLGSLLRLSYISNGEKKSWDYCLCWGVRANHDHLGLRHTERMSQHLLEKILLRNCIVSFSLLRLYMVDLNASVYVIREFRAWLKVSVHYSYREFTLHGFQHVAVFVPMRIYEAYSISFLRHTCQAQHCCFSLKHIF